MPNGEYQRKQGDQVQGDAKNCMKRNVPTNDTGTAMAGMRVDLQSPRKMKPQAPQG